MKNRLCLFSKINPLILFFFYYGITIIHCISFFLTSLWNAELISFLGNQSATLPIFGLLNAAEHSSVIVGCILLCYWIGSLLLLLICFIATLRKRNFTLFSVVVLLDAIFTIVFMVANMLQGDVMGLHFLMLLGALLDLALFYYVFACQQSTGEGLREPS